MIERSYGIEPFTFTSNFNCLLRSVKYLEPHRLQWQLFVRPQQKVEMFVSWRSKQMWTYEKLQTLSWIDCNAASNWLIRWNLMKTQMLNLLHQSPEVKPEKCQHCLIICEYVCHCLYLQCFQVLEISYKPKTKDRVKLWSVKAVKVSNRYHLLVTLLKRYLMMVLVGFTSSSSCVSEVSSSSSVLLNPWNTRISIWNKLI